ncbi:MAG TPA: hypothetical protein VKA59_06230 [Vicinamibacterales bacterium]|jgi:hypothetical protein|nr:hypothetical protein [Vicinamibacterales bacterium]
MRLLLTALFFEAGLVLVIVPWSNYWERNYFVQALPVIEPFLTSDYVRGAVSGLGVVNLLAGFVEIWSFLTTRHVPDPMVSISQAAPEE